MWTSDGLRIALRRMPRPPRPQRPATQVSSGFRVDQERRSEDGSPWSGGKNGLENDGHSVTIHCWMEHHASVVSLDTV
jgi:hypothetical protein